MLTSSDADGSSPDGGFFTVGTDGSHVVRRVDSPVATGHTFLPIFGITGGQPQGASIVVDGIPVNSKGPAT